MNYPLHPISRRRRDALQAIGGVALGQLLRLPSCLFQGPWAAQGDHSIVGSRRPAMPWAGFQGCIASAPFPKKVHRDRSKQPRSVDEVLRFWCRRLTGSAWVKRVGSLISPGFKNIVRPVLCSYSVRPPAVVAFSSVLTAVNALQINWMATSVV